MRPYGRGSKSGWLDEKQVKSILKSDNEVEKTWLIGRVLTHARYKDVWKYLTIDEIIKYLPYLKIKQETKNAWKNALNVWGYHV